ncbi:non-selective voltage-gated ion channel VDAC1 isoform 5 [Homo sapiens]|uniref:non-selective voltage-gated ion channel VDAC1 isoform 5 n=1 Tax=Homo sapiens TaxID=9606 RepID=UPI00004231AB|nr:voltage-dependent anion-selective channel protein 1 isoform 5 [Homo sapiens]
MAVPPTYADLGKSARDVFTKGYGFGLIKLDLKTKSENGLEFTSSGSANTETTKVTGSLETKYRWTEYGLTFTEKWNTDNTLGTEITVEDQLARGLKLTFDSSFSPNTGYLLEGGSTKCRPVLGVQCTQVTGHTWFLSSGDVVL